MFKHPVYQLNGYKLYSAKAHKIKLLGFELRNSIFQKSYMLIHAWDPYSNFSTDDTSFRSSNPYLLIIGPKKKARAALRNPYWLNEIAIDQ